MHEPEPKKDVFDLYLELDAQRAQLTAAAEKASGLTADLYASGVATAADRLEGMKADPMFLTIVKSIGEPLVRGLKELDELNPAVAAGLIDADLIDQRRAEIESEIGANERNRTAYALYSGSILVSKLVRQPEEIRDLSNLETAQNAPTLDSQKEAAPTLPIPITVTMQDNAIMIGEKGKYVKMTRAHSGQRDYTETRNAIFETLVKHQGKHLPIKELWQKTFGESVDFDNQAMTNVRKWLEKLTYRRQLIVEHNNKRGASSAYGITHFTVTLIKKEITRPITESSVNRPADPLEVTKSTPTSRNRGIHKEESIALPSKFPLKAYECLIFANFINITQPKVLNALGLDVIPENVIDKLQSSDSNRGASLFIEQHGTLKNGRRSILERLQKFFKDESLVLDTVAEMSEVDNRYELFEYLFNIDGEDRWLLLEQLVDAERQTIVEVDGSRRGGFAIKGIQHITNLDSVVTAPQPTPLIATPISEDIVAPEEDTKIITSVELEVPATESEKPADDWVGEFKKSIGDAISILEADGLMHQGEISARNASTKSSSKKMGTKEAVDRLRQAGIIRPKRAGGIPSESFPLTPKLLVAMYLLNSNADLLNKGPRQKEALKIIEDAISSYFAKRA